MNQTNGDRPGPPFAVIGTGLVIVPRAGVIEMLEKNILLHGKQNLALVPIFRKVQEDFRVWSKDAEPGWTFRAHEVGLVIIRMSVAGMFISLSDAARKQADAAQADPPPSDRPLIFHE
jgi:hypothetical protein